MAALAFAQGGYSSNTVAIVCVVAWFATLGGLVVCRGLPAAAGSALAAGGALAALAALAALSMIWANDAGRAFTAAVRAATYVGIFAGVLAWTPKAGARAWLGGIAGGIAIVVVASLAGRLDPSLFGGADRDIFARIPGAAGRLSYPIGYWNGLAAFVATGVVLSTWWSAHAASRLVRALAVATIPAYGLVLYLTASRGGIGQAIAGVAVLAWLDSRRARVVVGAAIGGLGAVVLSAIAQAQPDLLHALVTSAARDQGVVDAFATVAVCAVAGLAYALVERRLDGVRSGAPWHPRVIAAGGAVLVVVLSIAFAHMGDPGTSASPGQRDLLNSSGSGRYQYWQSALDAFGSSPVHGIGGGNWELYWNVQPKLPTAVHNAHSLYLETLAELGVIGLALLAAFLAITLLAGWRRAYRGEAEAAALLAVVVAGALGAGVDWTFQLVAVFAPVIAAAALLVARPAASPRRGAWTAAALAGVVAAAWICLWAAGTTLLANHHLSTSRDAAARGDLASAAEEAQSAADVEPFAAAPRIQLALVQEAAGNLTAAQLAAGEAVARASLDWQGWIVASEIARRQGDRKLSHDDRLVAKALAPAPLPR